MSWFARLVGVLSCALVPLAALADSCIWYADDDSVRQVRSSLNEVTATVPLKAPQRLAMNATDCGVWALSKEDKRLLRFSAEGAAELNIDLRTIDQSLDEPRELLVDAYDGSLRLADNKGIFHLSATGGLLASFPVPDEVRQVRISLDQTLWVLGARQLWHFDRTGVLLASHRLANDIGADANRFEVDSLGGAIWLAGEHQVSQLALANPAAPPVFQFRLSDNIAGLAIDPLSGAVWIAQQTALVSYSRSGALVRTVDTGALGARKPGTLAFDPASRSLWAGSDGFVLRFTAAGDLLGRFAARASDEVLGVPAFEVQPTLTLVRPPADALSNNPFLSFTLAYGAQCNGEACPFGNDYFNGYALDANVDGQQIASRFVLDPATAQASFTPTSRWSEGAHSFAAAVKDSFGHVSSTVAIGFTIDTIPPRFLSLAPADGSVLPTPNVLIQGTTDDPTATVALTGAGFGQTGASFAFPVVLQPGLNTFSLSATDRAGNVTVATLRLVLVTLSLNVDSPANGATVSGDGVTVSGTLQGPVNTGVTVNGLIATVTGTTFVVPNVPLQTGANTLSVVATTPDGQTATKAVSVTSTGAAPIRVTADVTQGIGPLKVTFSLTNGSGNTIRSLFIDFFGTGSFFDFGAFNTLSSTYAAGTYQVGFIINDSSGAQYTQTITVVVQDRAEIDQTLRAVWTGFTGALVAQDTSRALQYFSPLSARRYGPVLEALKPSLPEIVGNFAPFALSFISNGVGEYAVKRTNASGVTNLYLIYFVQGQDGVWRLDSM